MQVHRMKNYLFLLRKALVSVIQKLSCAVMIYYDIQLIWLFNSFPGRGAFNGSRSGGGRGRGRGRGRGKAHSEPPSATDLDDDLEKYRSEAMQTN